MLYNIFTSLFKWSLFYSIKYVDLQHPLQVFMTTRAELCTVYCKPSTLPTAELDSNDIIPTFVSNPVHQLDNEHIAGLLWGSKKQQIAGDNPCIFSFPQIISDCLEFDFPYSSSSHSSTAVVLKCVRSALSLL